MAALVVSATFAACSKDEAPVPQTNEVVGAELVGTNISVDFTRNTDTKLTDNGWEKTDELGLAWAVNTSAGTDQADSEGNYKQINQVGIAANHLFAVEEGSQVFSTRGNVYKGWHFGYFPFRYMEKPGEVLDFDINQEMTTKWDDDYYTTAAFYLSPSEFLTKEKHLVNNKLENVTYQMYRAVKTIGIRVVPTVEFSDPSLSGLNITKLTINAGAEVFTTGKAAVDPAKLATMVYDKNGNYDEAKTREAFYTKLPEALRAIVKKAPLHTLAAANSATTIISEDAGLDLSGVQTVRLNTLPANPVDIKQNSVKFTINVNGGSFSIGYTPDAKEGTPEYTNNLAIDAFIAAYANGGSMTSYYQIKEDGEVIYPEPRLTLELTPADFTPDYNSISNIEEWNDAVLVANALGKTEVPVFTVDGEIKITAEDIPAFPTRGLTVKTKGKGKIVVASDYVMPEELVAALDGADAVVVNAAATLTIEDGLKVDAKITNDGTIKVGVAEVKTITNNNRVEVVYGSKVTINDPKGTIAYNVLEGDSAYMINQMVNNVNVNTLVVANGVTFDLSMKDKNVIVTDPYYENVIPGATLAGMDKMNFELNGGTIVSTLGELKEVNNIVVKSGVNNVLNTNVSGNLEVAAGELTIDSTPYDEDGNKFTIYVTGNITNTGILNINATVETKDLTNSTRGESYIYVAEKETLWYTGLYTTGGTAEGRVLEKKVSAYDGETVTVVTPVDKVYTVSTASEFASVAKKGLQNGEVIKLTADIDMKGAKVGLYAYYNQEDIVIDGNGHTIYNIALSQPTENNGGAAGASFIYGYEGASITVKNLTIVGATCNGSEMPNVGVISAYNEGSLVLENVHVKNAVISAPSCVGGLVGYTTGNVTITNCSVSNSRISATANTDESWGAPAGGFIGLVNTKSVVVKNSDVNANTVKAYNSKWAGEKYGSVLKSFKEDGVTVPANVKL